MVENKRSSPGRAKTGYVRVCCEIQIEINEIFKEYEQLTHKKPVKSSVMESALIAEAEKLKKEMEEIENKNK
jgi:hypothetical protein